MTDVVVDPSVTTGPIAGSTKIYRDSVPFRRVNLSNGEHLDLYDTSGPYTDPEAVIGLDTGEAIEAAMEEKSRSSPNTATASIFHSHDVPSAASPGKTPLRVMTIAGSDSGGGAGIQADMRTFAMLGVHGLVAVTAVTVQNSLGVKGFHEIPLDVIAGQISAVASDIGIQAAKTGMLASSDDHHHCRRHLARAGSGRHGAPGGRPGVRVDARRSAAAPERTGFR